MVVGAVFPIALWFGLLKQTNLYIPSSPLNPLAVLGIAYGVGPWVIGVVQMCYISCKTSLQKEYDLKLLCSIPTDAWPIVRELAKEGLELMVVDITVQLSVTITIYTASHNGFESAYEIAAAQAAYFTWGPNYILYMGIIFKVIGARLIGEGKFGVFKRFFSFFTTMVLTLFVAGLIGGFVFGDAISLTFMESGCIYASDKGCASVYERIYIGEDSGKTVFEGFGPVVAFQLLFFLGR